MFPAACPPRPRAGALCSLAAVAIVAAAVILPATPGYADPDPAAIERQIAALWDEAEPLIEEHHQADEVYRQNLARQKQLAEAIAPLERELAFARARVGAIASEVYQSGQAGSLALLLSSATPGELTDRLTYLDQLTYEQSGRIATALDLKRELDQQKFAIDALVNVLAEQERELAARKAEIDRKIEELQKLRQQAYGSGQGTGQLEPVVCEKQLEYLPTKGHAAAEWACTQIGKPYVHATYGPDSYDCVGLTMAAWGRVGVRIPFSVRGQRDAMPYVERADLRSGDIIFFYSNLRHVGIYIGNGWMVHAPQPGDYVRMARIDRNAPIHSFGRPSPD